MRAVERPGSWNLLAMGCSAQGDLLQSALQACVMAGPGGSTLANDRPWQCTHHHQPWQCTHHPQVENPVAFAPGAAARAVAGAPARAVRLAAGRAAAHERRLVVPLRAPGRRARRRAQPGRRRRVRLARLGRAVGPALARGGRGAVRPAQGAPASLRPPGLLSTPKLRRLGSGRSVPSCARRGPALLQACRAASGSLVPALYPPEIAYMFSREGVYATRETASAAESGMVCVSAAGQGQRGLRERGAQRLGRAGGGRRRQRRRRACRPGCSGGARLWRWG